MQHPIRVMVSLLLAASIAIAHSGGLDANGGHMDRKTGTYHTHRSPSSSPTSTQRSPSSSPTSTQRNNASSRPTASQEQAKQKGTLTLSNETKERRLGEYFRNANAGLASKPIGVIYERKVSEATKRKVIARDGGRCVVCGSTMKLEVDHKAALMNGGTNDESNLATLCDDCHLAKTKMDNSLRRHRQKDK
jgi:predicted HNH restriction endonuclease